MVIVLLAQVADTPVGNPLAPDTPEFKIPVAPVVVIVIGVSAVLVQRVGVEDGEPAVQVTEPTFNIPEFAAK